MKVNEVVSGFTKRYIASVRCEVAGMGTTTARVGIDADSATSAKFLLSRLYGRANVMGVQEAQQGIQKAQAKLAKINQSSISSGIG
jgi:hypothetical protein